MSAAQKCPALFLYCNQITNMRKLIIFAAAALLLSACKKECDLYHTGTNCKTEVREKFTFRYNSRNAGEVERFDVSLAQTNNFRLTYKQLIAN